MLDVEFLAQVADVAVDRPLVSLVVVADCGLHQLQAGEHATGAARQDGEQFELGRGERDLLAVAGRALAEEVDAQRADGDDIGLVHCGACAPQDGADPGHQLAHAHGLHKVIVGAEFEPDDDIRFFAASRHHDDRCLELAANAARDVKAAHPGHHPVEDDQVGVFLQRKAQRLIAACRRVHAISLTGEVVAHDLAQRRIIFGDQKAFASHASRICFRAARYLPETPDNGDLHNIATICLGDRLEWQQEDYLGVVPVARAVVIGAGLVGLLAAYHLRRQGLDVTVVERGDPGMACSFGNAGWICPSLSAPLPAPGLPLRTMRWMLSRQSPVYISPGVAPSLFGWLRAFWRSCTAERNEAGLAAMLALNQRTLALFDELAADGIDMEMHTRGVLFCFLGERELAAEYEDLERIGRYGFPAPHLLTGDEARGAEPSLAPRVTGGILLAHERHVEPLSLSRGIARRLIRDGVELRAHTGAVGFERSRDAVQAVRTDDGRIAGDIFVLAAGVWSGALAQQLGIRLPIQAGKGYSLTFPRLRTGVRHALYFGDTKVVLSQYDAALRIAGTMEFSGHNEYLDPARIRSLRAAAQRYLAAELPAGDGVAWTGMRPMTPDGLPAIGRLPGLRNAFVSTGHATNGVFMAPSSGEALAQLAVHGEAGVDMAPFDPGRFFRA
jgi:D-amino-acid dehydrogenase